MAYRIVQEALTNVVKHSWATSARVVVVGYRPDEVTVEVTGDDTTPPGGGPAGRLRRLPGGGPAAVVTIVAKATP